VRGLDANDGKVAYFSVVAKNSTKEATTALPERTMASKRSSLFQMWTGLRIGQRRQAPLLNRFCPPPTPAGYSLLQPKGWLRNGHPLPQFQNGKVYKKVTLLTNSQNFAFFSTG